MLARLAGVWKVLRTERGKSAAWTGSFVTAEDALASIDEPSGCGPLLIPIIAAKVLA
jgi:hypothetical protein